MRREASDDQAIFAFPDIARIGALSLPRRRLKLYYVGYLGMHYDSHSVEDAVFEEIEEVTFEVWTSLRRPSPPTWVRVGMSTLDEAADWIAANGDDALFEIRDSLGNVYKAAEGEHRPPPSSKRGALDGLSDEVKVRLKLYGVMLIATIAVEAVLGAILKMFDIYVSGVGKFLIIFMITAIFMPLRERGAK